MPFSRDDPAFARRCSFAARGRARAAFWRKQGWPNLQRAWQGRRRYCQELRAGWTEEEKRKHDDAAERARRWREKKARDLGWDDPCVRDLEQRWRLLSRDNPLLPYFREVPREIRAGRKLERMLGARERRNARARQRRSMERRGMASPAEPRRDFLAGVAQDCPVLSAAPREPQPLPAKPLPQSGFADIPLAGGGSRRVFRW